ncbi:MAG: TonB family protein [Alphaproteobacteria bacterium]|nr:TonB family protein [Alphaproteobacteria bacterium]
MLAVIGLLTLFFRNNGAHVRHALWTAASLKFLVPLFLLFGWGMDMARVLDVRSPPLAAVETFYAVGQPFSDGPIFRAMPFPSLPAWIGFLVFWLAGIVAILAFWFARWLTLRAAVRTGRRSSIAAPMPVRISSTQIEPGLVGIISPVLLLPQGIMEHLSPAELQTVITHEACHLRRYDNLWAALHMLVQALFWFFPPVWWLGARLMAERERACDEAVLAAGNDPQTYAESILKVCKFYVASPLACAAGVASADLNNRMETIMENRTLVCLNGMKKLLLVSVACVLVQVPLAAGLFWSPGAQGAPACKVEGIMATHTLPPYPPESAKAKETGAVLLNLTIAHNGHVSRAQIAQSSGHSRLDRAALTHVRQNYLWQPLSCASAQTNVRVVFNLGTRPEPFDQARWVKNLQNRGAKVEQLGGNKFQVTLPTPPAAH